MSFLRLNRITTRVLTQGRLVSSVIESAAGVRWIASNNQNNGKKCPSNTGMILYKIPESMQKSKSKSLQIPFTSPIIRECQTKSGSSGSSTPPPSDSSTSDGNNNDNRTLLFAAIAALLVGGGSYVIFKSKSGEHEKPSEVPQKAVVHQKPKVPATSADIPEEVPYLLIGGGTASFAAFRAIKSHEPKAKIMVLSNETETPYMRPPLSKELWLADSARTKAASKEDPESLKFKQWNGVERSLYYEPDDFYIHPTKLSDEPNGGVAIVRGYTVKKIDVQNRIAILTDGTAIKYDKCLIATGSRPKTLPEFENASPQVKQRVSLFKTIEDYGTLKRSVDNSKSVAIIGGGFLGSELACALAKYGEDRKLQVHQIFHEPGNMGKVLPEFLSKWTSDRVREENVNIIPNTHVQSVALISNNQLNLKLKNGSSVICDHAIVAVGSEPNVDLAAESSLEVDNVHGGYLVNAELEARNNLYVAGDAACFYDPRLGRRRVEHHDHAVVSGRLAGENMVGLHKPYTHQSMFWSDLGPKVGYEAIGIIDSTLPTVSVFVKPEPSAKQPKKDESLAAKADSITPSVQAAVTNNDNTNKNDEEVPDDFSKGVVFYLRDEKIVGIILWNVFNRINTARAVVSQDKIYDDLNEVAKLFDIHA